MDNRVDGATKEADTEDGAAKEADTEDTTCKLCHFF